MPQTHAVRPNVGLGYPIPVFRGFTFAPAGGYNRLAPQNRHLLLLTDFGQFLIDLKAALAPVFAHAPAEPRPRDDYMREDIRRFVENNIANCDFSLDTLASEFHLSANYMGAMVKKLFGQSYKDYVTAARMQKAKELLLRCPNMTVNEISLRVGYRKASNFIQKFKDFTGATPLHFREQRGEEE